MKRSLIEFDLEAVSGCSGIAGVDEAGRGALAGPVVASAVGLSKDFYADRQSFPEISEVNDSKKLSNRQRKRVFEGLWKLRDSGSIEIEIGVSSVSEIEKMNILGATRVAMCRALYRLPEAFPEGVEPAASREKKFLFLRGCDDSATTPDRPMIRRTHHKILVDGKPLSPFPYKHTAVVKGDGKSLAIAMASVVAKVVRDRIMCGLDSLHPCYGFSNNKGYGTDSHCAAIRNKGPSQHHRRLFLRRLMEPEAKRTQLEFHHS